MNATFGNNALSMYTDPAAIAAAESAKARIQSAYMIALHKPRNYDQARVKIMDACRRPEFAEKVEYSKPVGNGNITGASIRFAELALREWGNVLYENQVIYDDDTVRRIRVTVIDLETNATFGKEIQIGKTVERKNSKGREVIGDRLNSYGEKVYIVKATEDEVQTRESAMISKALRNEGLRLIPQEIVEEAVETARKTMNAKDKQDPDAARKKLVDAFFAMGIQPTDLEKYLGHPVAQCVPAELQDLRKIYSAIKEGEAKWADFASTGDEPEPSGDDKLKSQLLGKPKQQEAPKKPAEPKVQPPAPNDFPLDNGPKLKQPEVNDFQNGNSSEPKQDLAPIDPNMLPFGDEPTTHGGEKIATNGYKSESEKLRERLSGILNLTSQELDDWCNQRFGKVLKDLDKDELKAAIKRA